MRVRPLLTSTPCRRPDVLASEIADRFETAPEQFTKIASRLKTTA
jgi:hypothetical protein